MLSPWNLELYRGKVLLEVIIVNQHNGGICTATSFFLLNLVKKLPWSGRIGEV